MNRRATFGPVVLVGLATAGLAAVAGNKPWTDVQEPGGECGMYPPPGIDWSSLAQGAPLAGALSLLLLAGWGVLLVTRGRARRAMAALMVLVSIGYLATSVSAYWFVKDAVLRKAGDRVGEMPAGCQPASVWMDNSWWFAALATGALAVVTCLLALRLCASWPEMGTKYDAPVGGTAEGVPVVGEATNIDLWKALDAGQDPTAETPETAPDPAPDPTRDGPGDDAASQT